MEFPHFIEEYIDWKNILEKAFQKLDFVAVRYIHEEKLVDSYYFLKHLNWEIAYTSRKNAMVLLLKELGYV